MTAVSDPVMAFVIPLSVLISAAATTTTAVIAWRLYKTVMVHDRTLFGEPEFDGRDGIVSSVNRTQHIAEQNRRDLRAADMTSEQRRTYEDSDDEDTHGTRGGPRW
jgi:hypothetical protein